MPTKAHHERHKLHLRHFRRADPAIAEVIRLVGPMRIASRRDRFEMLARSIISQQISTAAARSIRQRLETLCGDGGVTPERLAALSPADLRTAGVSPQKAAYLRDLAAHAADGRVRLKTIGRKRDDEVIDELVQVKGIGRWTAQMFLIFALGRQDVFPRDDLGVRAAIRRLHALPSMPERKYLDGVAERWRPFGTVGSWYCWRYLELDRETVKPS